MLFGIFLMLYDCLIVLLSCIFIAVLGNGSVHTYIMNCTTNSTMMMIMRVLSQSWTVRNSALKPTNYVTYTLTHYNLHVTVRNNTAPGCIFVIILLMKQTPSEKKSSLVSQNSVHFALCIMLLR